MELLRKNLQPPTLIRHKAMHVQLIYSQSLHLSVVIVVLTYMAKIIQKYSIVVITPYHAFIFYLVYFETIRPRLFTRVTRRVTQVEH